MGMYLNSMAAYDAYKEICDSLYFVDKSSMLAQIIPRIGTPGKNICITRPRRFGKSVMANMIAAFFTRGCEAKELFNELDIVKVLTGDSVRKNLNQHNVIHISFNEIPRRCRTYEQYISRIENSLLDDLKTAYPDVCINANDAVWDVLKKIYTMDNTARFIFVLDEWDFIFHRDFVTESDKADYIDFLSNLLKDKPYVSLAYMTGILPIAKYSSGSELNMFLEYTMASEEMYGDCFGFTESEVDELFDRFLMNQSNPLVTREGLRTWYDGYHTKSGERVYNPRSVVVSLTNNNLGNYWTSSGPYDEIFYYIEQNTAAVREDLARMVSGISVPAKIKEYAATSMNLTTKDEIFSAMVVYGFLSYENGCVAIPNRELMDKFSDMLMKEPSLGYMYRLANTSSEMLKATLEGDAEKVAEIMAFAHNTESPLLSYSTESELTVLVTLVYLSARDFYRIEREDKAGVGYVDFIFYPEVDHSADGIILELKVDHTAEDALQQIKDRQYALQFEGKMGEKPKYTGRILGVGIAYDRAAKRHECKIEVLRKRLTLSK
ncbi:AAA family ATPase [Ruminococcus sp. 5_1_39BFAA]|uniref:AAA family ATPase n=1 Tax=Ruminococcus sp. 5_1_39BFAA TaxID=457412 RepID=UPI003562C00B